MKLAEQLLEEEQVKGKIPLVSGIICGGAKNYFSKR